VKIKILLIALLVCGAAYASTCSYDAFMQACHSCTFDASGKMNQSCYEQYQQSGQSCVAVTYPVLAGVYKAGKCPQVDTCASELQSCKSIYETGNDSADCNNPQIEECFIQSDVCVDKAASACAGVSLSSCPLMMILPAILGGALYSQSRRST
jgi:hypothetical protein